MITLRRTIPLAMLTTALGAAWVAGCDNKPPETPPQPIPDAGVVDAEPPPPPPPPAPTVAECDPVQAAALTTMFEGRKVGEAPQMQPEGAPVCKVIPEGQTASSEIILLQQGFCYTVLGASLPPVAEMDMQLELDLAGGAGLPPALAALGGIKPMLLTDTETGNSASMGAKQNCYKWPYPIPAAARVTMKARTGSGPMAAQVYKKKAAF